MNLSHYTVIGTPAEKCKPVLEQMIEHVFAGLFSRSTAVHFTTEQGWYQKSKDFSEEKPRSVYVCSINFPFDSPSSDVTKYHSKDEVIKRVLSELENEATREKFQTICGSGLENWDHGSDVSVPTVELGFKLKLRQDPANSIDVYLCYVYGGD